MHLEAYKDSAHEWRWRRIAENGRIVADSGEGYQNKQDCLNMAVEQFPEDEVIEIEEESV